MCLNFLKSLFSKLLYQNFLTLFLLLFFFSSKQTPLLKFFHTTTIMAAILTIVVSFIFLKITHIKKGLTQFKSYKQSSVYHTRPIRFTIIIKSGWQLLINKHFFFFLKTTIIFQKKNITRHHQNYRHLATKQ